MIEATLNLRGVRFSYEGGTWGLSIPELTLGRECMTCIVGPNGSGKSTLLRLAAGILRPTAGAVELKNCPLATMRRRTIARSLGFLPQEIPPLFDYTVEEVVGMGRYAHLRGIGVMTERDSLAIEQALEAVDIAALRKRPLSHLSGGERRRALIASVLAQEPEILLLDEPTSSLDIHHAAAVMRLLSGFNGKGPAVVVVTHDINLAALFGRRLLLVANGRVCADGAPEEVVCPEVMAHAYGQELLFRTHPETGGPMLVPRRHAPGAGSVSDA